MADKPIEDYGLLSDRHSAALVARDGSVDWLCWPRYDSPSVFGALLGEQAGHWTIHPTAPAEISRAYIDDTLVLRTTFSTATGELVLTDALAAGRADDPHRLGEDAPHVLIREATCVRGSVEVGLEFVPRPEYGLVVPLIAKTTRGLTAQGGPAVLVLDAPIDLELTDSGAHATTTVQSGQAIRFALHWAPLAGPVPKPWSQEEIGHNLQATIAIWQAWSETHQGYTGPWPDLVRHSGRVLHGLGYQPTGAIVAAATTSLPEAVGGQRNWDYRYTWIRDAAFTMDALWAAACPDEAVDFFRFVTSAAATTRPESHLQIMYGVGGEHDLTERTLPHLPGWRGSRPVRVGNGAWTQAQLDVHGELLATAARYADQLPADDPQLRTFLIQLADTVARVWRQPDHGIWEIRGEPRHFLHSKLMCWVALDRAVGLSGQLGAGDRAGSWSAARDEIRAAIEREGWNDRVGAYTQSFGSDQLDASTLMIPIVGFAPGTDPRVQATVAAVARELTGDHGLVYRYRTETGVDGLDGEEGAFLLCTFWLARAWALGRRVDEAHTVFERAAGYANDLGLLSEQVDGASHRLLGNFPQAFSHIGLINTAYTIGEAEKAA